MGNALEFAARLLDLIGLLASTGQAVAEISAWGRRTVRTLIKEGRDPTGAEWDALNACIDALRMRIHEDD